MEKSEEGFIVHEPEAVHPSFINPAEHEEIKRVHHDAPAIVKRPASKKRGAKKRSKRGGAKR